MNKGQISLEFMLLISIMLLYISTIILPNVEIASSAAKEVAGVSQGRLAAEKIVDTANFISLSGINSRQTIKIYIPQNASIDCDEVGLTSADINFTYVLQNTEPITACNPPSNVCEKLLRTVSGQAFQCLNFPVIGPSTPRIKIEKILDTATGTKVVINATQN